MISLQFVSEINKVLKARGINKKELAHLINVSPSYVTQVFNGNKTAGYEMLAKIQKKLGIKYGINAIAEELVPNVTIDDTKWNEVQINIFLNKYKHSKGCFIYKKDAFSGRNNNALNSINQSINTIPQNLTSIAV